MTTVAYLAVSPEGRTDRHCVLLREPVLPGLRKLTDGCTPRGVRLGPDRSCRAGGQQPFERDARRLSASRRLSPSGAITRAATDADITRITDEYRRGAEVAVEAGFDCIEIHLGHNYLLSAFLSPKLNRRTDRWGGSLDNRARFPRQVVGAVREAVGNRVAVTAKLNMADGVPGWVLARREHRVRPHARVRRRARCHRVDRGAAPCRIRCTCSGERRPGKEFARHPSSSAAFGVPGCRDTVPPRVPVRGGLLPALCPAVPGVHCRCRSSCWVASTDSRRSKARWPRASSSWPWPVRCCGSPIWSPGGSRDGAGRTVHPLQQVHAHHLQRHPLRSGR